MNALKTSRKRNENERRNKGC